MITARWIDEGALAPFDLHATYTGLCEAQAPDAAPVVLWAHPAQAHVSIGAGQYADADLDVAACRELGIPIVQRPLGGGSVWLDAHQYGFFVIFPASLMSGPRAGIFDACLPPLVQVMRAQGMAARRNGGQDIWVGDKKILGSGAAGIGQATVFGASFLMRFNAAAFARVVRAPSEAFRQWLVQALEEGMTDWQDQGVDADEAWLKRTLMDRLGNALGWRFVEDDISDAERRSIAEAGEELHAPLESGGQRHVRYGIKINQRRYLLERKVGEHSLRVLVEAARVARIEHSDPAFDAALGACVGEPIDRRRLSRVLSDQGLRRAQALAQDVVDICKGVDLTRDESR